MPILSRFETLFTSILCLLAVFFFPDFDGTWLCSLVHWCHSLLISARELNCQQDNVTLTKLINLVKSRSASTKEDSGKHKNCFMFVLFCEYIHVWLPSFISLTQKTIILWLDAPKTGHSRIKDCQSVFLNLQTKLSLMTSKISVKITSVCILKIQVGMWKMSPLMKGNSSLSSPLKTIEVVHLQYTLGAPF